MTAIHSSTSGSVDGAQAPLAKLVDMLMSKGKIIEFKSNSGYTNIAVSMCSGATVEVLIRYDKAEAGVSSAVTEEEIGDNPTFGDERTYTQSFNQLNNFLRAHGVDVPGDSDTSYPSQNDASASDDQQTIADFLEELSNEESVDPHSHHTLVATGETTEEELVGMGAWIEPDSQIANDGVYGMFEDMNLNLGELLEDPVHSVLM